MAQTRLALEPEVQSIFDHVDQGKNFLLSGGAGSGKTYSLVQFIRQVLAEDPKKTIACITYTNAAVAEIRGRISAPNLHVGTIHEFLWDIIRPYKAELIDALIFSLKSESPTSIKNPDDKFDPEVLRGAEVQYKEYTRVREAIVSHDEILKLAHGMFSAYPKLCDIAKDRYKFILVDEYQDTSELVVDILLVHFQKSSKTSIIGFFGDAMQSIYDEGVGDLNKYRKLGLVEEVKKLQNRRNPKLIYELANRLRTDGITQEASTDENAPNMSEGKVICGNMKLVFTATDLDKLDEVKDSLGWDFKDVKENKELNLTHNLIAPKAGFAELMLIYDGDKIIAYRNRIKDFIKDGNIEEDFSGFTFGEVIDYLVERFPGNVKDVTPTKGMKPFIDSHQELYQIALATPYVTFRRMYVAKESLIDDKKDDPSATSKAGSKRDALIKHLFKIQNIINLYETGRYNEFLKRTEFKIRSVEDKRLLKKIIDEISAMSDRSIGEVIDRADELGVCKKDDNLSIFFSRSRYLYERVISVKFNEFQNLFRYLEGYTPFSTQHKIKGAQFDNVLVILDNGNWNNYNFKYIFEGAGNESVIERTRKLFYVCCTRSKRSLVVYYRNPSEKALATARKWFGDECVQCID
ncbi:UvrD-helicase domain-containing protein [Pseudomonas avellanae]|uniref:UvrD-helicase domain-containing protein n=1 Tax=Pseudomonas avellanae TaxID=46257 RepID=UPI00028C18D5|nr:UvrD-helicase domain-containing protein [Pseudomonas avellanae]EKG29662.1 ATP-dependent DNA helicase pcrA [Pseudomonas avellanae BPIC 631]UQW71274.1 UvrD-helicase domain-containing protein [Pseudomonas avellanae]GGJ51181.1 DNA helicase [Pseudomonas avellanae]